MSGVKKSKFLIIAVAVAVVFVGAEFAIYNIFFASHDIGVRVEEETDGHYKVGAERAKKAKKVSEHEISLDDYKTDIAISESGIYTLSGKLAHSVFIMEDAEVTLKLEGVEITSEQTAAIANTGAGKLTIYTEKETKNRLRDGGDDEYDGCIYSRGEVELTGEGALGIVASQKTGSGIAVRNGKITFNSGNYRIESNNDGIKAEGTEPGEIEINGGDIQVIVRGDGIDAGGRVVINGGYLYLMSATEAGKVPIGTKDGYYINGGTVVGLATDTMEAPREAAQGYHVEKLEKDLENGDAISLIKAGEGNEVIRVTLGEKCNTILISNEKMDKSTGYELVEIIK